MRGVVAGARGHEANSPRDALRLPRFDAPGSAPEQDAEPVCHSPRSVLGESDRQDGAICVSPTASAAGLAEWPLLGGPCGATHKVGTPRRRESRQRGHAIATTSLTRGGRAARWRNGRNGDQRSPLQRTLRAAGHALHRRLYLRGGTSCAALPAFRTTRSPPQENDFVVQMVLSLPSPMIRLPMILPYPDLCDPCGQPNPGIRRSSRQSSRQSMARSPSRIGRVRAAWLART